MKGFAFTKNKSLTFKFRWMMLLLAFHLLRISFSWVGSSASPKSPCHSQSFSLIDKTVVTKSGVSYFFPGGKIARFSLGGAIGKNLATISVVSDELGFCTLAVCCSQMPLVRLSEVYDYICWNKQRNWSPLRKWIAPLETGRYVKHVKGENCFGTN